MKDFTSAGEWQGTIPGSLPTEQNRAWSIVLYREPVKVLKTEQQRAGLKT
ncbi:MAG TPA: hypothetical protein VN794_10530 [Methylomirabilota bacterium]|nr:hypothetical protein [Methylomirabilota bacterium]